MIIKLKILNLIQVIGNNSNMEDIISIENQTSITESQDFELNFKSFHRKHN
jgi:hypothetical protein